jgi:glycerol-3-phosphate dehydrogenase
VNLRHHPLGAPLQQRFNQGFVYSDGWVDDARLVVINALDAQTHGAQILTRTRCVAAQRGAQGWTATLRSRNGQERTLGARALVNAAGPWAESFLRGETRSAHGEALATRSLRLIKGSHIVVPRCFEHDHAYIFQNPDKRIIFAIPYEERFTLIGTTDVELLGDPREARVDDDEVAYLCAQASRYFARPIEASEVVWRYAGVRPLLDDASDDPAAVTRDYLLESNTEAAPLLSVWGGKITTFRKLAEEAADEIGRMLGEARAAWTKGASLPGGDFTAWIGRPVSPDTDFERFVLAVRSRYPWLEAALARRLARAYGSRIERVLEGADSRSGLGGEVAPGLFEIELRYLRREEWACTAEDVLWRRTKRGLHLSECERERVADWMDRANEHRKVA